MPRALLAVLSLVVVVGAIALLGDSHPALAAVLALLGALGGLGAAGGALSGFGRQAEQQEVLGSRTHVPGFERPRSDGDLL